MNTENRNETARADEPAPVPGNPGAATRRSALTRSREYLSARLATREGSIGVFKAHESTFQSSGFGPKSR
jgi:hypothetical protein